MKSLLVTVLIILSLSGISQGLPGNEFISSSPCFGKQVSPACWSSQVAALLNLETGSVAISSIRHFLLPELSSYHLTANLPLQQGMAGAEITTTGFSAYRQSTIGVAYARKLGSQLSIGLRFNYTNVHGSEINRSAISGDVAALLPVSKQLAIELGVNHIITGSFAKTNQSFKLPSSFQLGCCYAIDAHFYSQLRIVKVVSQPVNVLASLQYAFTKELYARLGINSNSTTLFGAIGFNWRAMTVCVSSSYHSILGISPGLHFSLLFKKPAV